MFFCLIGKIILKSGVLKYIYNPITTKKQILIKLTGIVINFYNNYFFLWKMLLLL